MDSIAHVTDNAVDQVKRNASFAKGSLLELGTQTLKLITAFRQMEARGTNRLLARLGLQRRRSRLTPAIWFAAGAVTAGITAIMLAPASGRETRSRLNRKLDDGVRGAKQMGKQVEGKIEGAINDARSEIKSRMPETAGAVSQAMGDRASQ